MKNAHTAQRIAAHVIDVIILTIFVSMITFGIPKSQKYKEAEKKINSITESVFLDDEEKIDSTDKLIENKYIYDKESIPFNLISIVVSIGYFGVFAYYNSGQTIGKKLVHIKVVSDDDSEANNSQMFGRALLFDGTFLSILSIVLLTFIKSKEYPYTVGILGLIQSFIILCSFFMIAYRKDKRGLHDLICRTKVVEC